MIVKRYYLKSFTTRHVENPEYHCFRELTDWLNDSAEDVIIKHVYVDKPSIKIATVTVLYSCQVNDNLPEAE